MANIAKTVAGRLALGAATATVTVLACWPASGNAPDLTVTQKGREFRPGAITVAKDQVVTIVNDDADLLHHAYVESDTFNFDSGDQQPGSRMAITFTTAGDYKVLCGIHPKMKMLVHVQ